MPSVKQTLAMKPIERKLREIAERHGIVYNPDMTLVEFATACVARQEFMAAKQTQDEQDGNR